MYLLPQEGVNLYARDEEQENVEEKLPRKFMVLFVAVDWAQNDLVSQGYDATVLLG